MDTPVGIRQLANFLNGDPKNYCLLEARDFSRGWFTVREKLEGEVLGKKIANGEQIDRWDIIKQALQWTIFLAKNGYYQSDLHTGNFICSKDGKIYPIDYELMINNPYALSWPHNIRLMFFYFMNSILEPHFDKVKRLDYHTNGKMLLEFRKHISEYQYRQILQLKDSEDFFEKLYEILFPSKEKKNCIQW